LLGGQTADHTTRPWHSHMERILRSMPQSQDDRVSRAQRGRRCGRPHNATQTDTYQPLWKKNHHDLSYPGSGHQLLTCLASYTASNRHYPRSSHYPPLRISCRYHSFALDHSKWQIQRLQSPWRSGVGHNDAPSHLVRIRIRAGETMRRKTSMSAGIYLESRPLACLADHHQRAPNDAGAATGTTLDHQ